MPRASPSFIDTPGSRRAFRGDFTSVDYSENTVEELKAACFNRGIRVTGTTKHKHQYIEAIVQDDLSRYLVTKLDRNNSTDPSGSVRRQWVKDWGHRRTLANEMIGKAVIFHYETMLEKMKTLYKNNGEEIAKDVHRDLREISHVVTFGAGDAATKTKAAEDQKQATASVSSSSSGLERIEPNGGENARYGINGMEQERAMKRAESVSDGSTKHSATFDQAAAPSNAKEKAVENTTVSTSMRADSHKAVVENVGGCAPGQVDDGKAMVEDLIASSPAQAHVNKAITAKNAPSDTTRSQSKQTSPASPSLSHPQDHEFQHCQDYGFYLEAILTQHVP